MRAVGYGDWNWEGEGFSAGVPNWFVPVVSVTPVILQRAGTTAAFGPSQIGEMTVPCRFGYRGGLTWEQAMSRLVKRLKPTDPTPRQLRVVRNDGVACSTYAVLSIPPGAGESDDSFFLVTFVAVDAYWVADGTNVASAVIAP